MAFVTVLADGDRFELCRFDGGQPAAVAPWPRPTFAHAVSPDGRYVVGWSVDDQLLWWIDLSPTSPYRSGPGPTAIEWRPPPAFRLLCACVSATGEVFVGGGSSEAESLLQLSFDAAGQPTSRVIEIPEEVRFHGKSVDGLHLVGNRLVAIDNILLPKWVLEYAVYPEESGLAKVALTRTVRLQANTTYEHIAQTALGQNHIALLSRGSNHGLASTHVTLLATDTLERVWHDGHAMTRADKPGFLGRLTGERPRHTLSEEPPLFSVALGMKHLFVAAGDAGIGVVDLHQLQSEPRLEFSAIGFPVVWVSASPAEVGCFALFSYPGYGLKWRKFTPGI